MRAGRPHRGRDVELDPPPRNPQRWWRAISSRSLVLVVIYGIARIALGIAEAVIPDPWPGRLHTAAGVATSIAGLSAVVSLIVDVVRARRDVTTARSRWWYRGYVAALIDTLQLRRRTSNVVDLTSRRRALPTGPAPTVLIGRVVDEPAPRRWPRPVLLILALIALVLLGDLWMALRPSDHQQNAQPPVLVTPTSSSSPSATSSGQPGGPTATPPTGTPPTRAPGGAPATPAAQPSSNPPATTPTTVTAAKLSGGPLSDGTYTVGVDVAPGTWKAGAVATIPLGGCVYSVNGGPAQAPLLTVGAVTVTLKAGDKLTTAGCPPWRLA